MTAGLLKNGDPWYALMLAVILQAVQDVAEGDASAWLWLWVADDFGFDTVLGLDWIGVREWLLFGGKVPKLYRKREYA